MARYSIKEVLIRRDGFSPKEAEERVQQAREDIMELITAGEYPFDFCLDEFGLEPDYLEDLIGLY